MSSALRDRPDTLADSQLGVLNNINISGSVLDRAETGRPTRVFFFIVSEKAEVRYLQQLSMLNVDSRDLCERSLIYFERFISFLTLHPT